MNGKTLTPEQCSKLSIYILMSNLEKWLISIELEKVIKDIQKRACPECPAEEYCKSSPLNSCTEVLKAWAKEEAA